MLVFLSTGIPVAFAVGIAGLGAFFLFSGSEGLLMARGIPFYKGFSFQLLAIPFFILAGHILHQTGIVASFFQTANNWVRRVPGAMGVATLLVCGAFSAVLGSGAAATATMSTVAYPQLRDRGFDARLSFGILTGGGSLGPVIPPSGVLILYGVLTEVSVAKLFMAALIPGIIAMLVMAAYVSIRSLINPNLAPQGPLVSWREKITSLRHVIPLLILILIVLGSIYTGWATPSEAAALSVVAAFCLMLIYRAFSWKYIQGALRETILNASFIVIIVVFALTMATVLLYYNFGGFLLEKILEWQLSKWTVFCFLMLLYLFWGMFIDGVSIIVISVPLLAGVLQQLGFDLIWFGVICVIMVEIATMTPPFGMHLFIVRGITGESFVDIAMGTLPFVFLWLGVVALLCFFPELTLWLPRVLISQLIT